MAPRDKTQSPFGNCSLFYSWLIPEFLKLSIKQKLLLSVLISKDSGGKVTKRTEKICKIDRNFLHTANNFIINAF